MPEPIGSAELVTAAEIARRAAVTRATVSNWRRRHADFPEPVGGTQSSPGFDWAEVLAWLEHHGRVAELSPIEVLRTEIGGKTTAVLEKLIEALPNLLSSRLSRRPSLETVEQLRNELGDDLTGKFVHAVSVEGPHRILDLIMTVSGQELPRPSVVLPAPIAELMVLLTFPDEDQLPDSLLDPAANVAALPEAAAKLGVPSVYAQADRSMLAARTDALTRLVNPDTFVTTGVGLDLYKDAFPNVRTEAVVCVAPFGEDDWGYDALLGDERWIFGEPPRKEPALAWVQHCISHLEPDGTASVLMPSTIANRGRGAQVKSKLVKEGALRAVISLPPWAGLPNGVRADLWILGAPDPTAYQVLFIDLTRPLSWSLEENGYRRTDEPDDPGAVRDKVLDIWDRVSLEPFDNPEEAQWVPIRDLVEANAGLAPQRHVRPKPPEHEPEAFEALARDLRLRLVKSTRLLQGLNRGNRLQAGGIERTAWRTVRVADLARSEAVTLYSAGPSQPRIGGADPSPWTLEEGDIIIPESLHGNAVRVTLVTGSLAGETIGPRRHVLRPDRGRLDSWFLFGFLSAAARQHQETSPSGISSRVEVRRLRVPLIPLEEQRRYGKEFQRLELLRKAAGLTERVAEVSAHTLGAGLTGGWLVPPEPDEREHAPPDEG